MLGYFTCHYPDELLYSLCARYSDEMRYPKKFIVFEALFGYRGPVPSIDLPGRLGILAARLPSEYEYTVDDLIEKHTLWPYYSAFLAPEKACAVREGMLSDDRRRTETY